jgi:hypothetical protein
MQNGGARPAKWLVEGQSCYDRSSKERLRKAFQVVIPRELYDLITQAEDINDESNCPVRESIER